MNPTPTAINPGPVMSAGKNQTIVGAQTTQPSMRGTILGWFKPMIIAVVTEAIIPSGPRQGEVAQTEREIFTSGMMQPGDAEKLDVRAEGQRSWENWVLHVFPQLDVKTDTVIKIKGTPYRVMKRTDYIINGYVRYEIVEDYKP